MGPIEVEPRSSALWRRVVDVMDDSNVFIGGLGVRVTLECGHQVGWFGWYRGDGERARDAGGAICEQCRESLLVEIYASPAGKEAARYLFVEGETETEG